MLSNNNITSKKNKPTSSKKIKKTNNASYEMETMKTPIPIESPLNLVEDSNVFSEIPFKKNETVLKRYDNGVIIKEEAQENCLVTSLKSTSSCLPSLMRVPLCVLNPKSATKFNEIGFNWSRVVNSKKEFYSFKLKRLASVPLPTIIHAKYLDILLSMFAQNWNEKGLLYFRYSDVLNIAGRSKREIDSLKETIERYGQTPTVWQNSWSSQLQTVTFTIIRASTLDLKKQPKNSKNKETWQCIQFDKVIVDAFKNEKEKRIFSTPLFKELNNDEYIIYRFFYSFPETSKKIGREGEPNYTWRNYDELMKVFNWTGRKDKFKAWLFKNLEILQQKNLIQKPMFNTKLNAIGVNCINLKRFQEDRKIRKVTMISKSENPSPLILKDGFLCYEGTFEKVGKKKDYKGSAAQINRTPFKNLSDADKIAEYKARTKLGLVNPELVQIINTFLNHKNFALVVSYIDKYVLTN